MFDETKKNRIIKGVNSSRVVASQGQTSNKSQSQRGQKFLIGKSKTDLLSGRETISDRIPNQKSRIDSRNTLQPYQNNRNSCGASNQENFRNYSVAGAADEEIVSGNIRHQGPYRRKDDNKVSKSLDWNDSFHKYQDFRRSFESGRSRSSFFDDTSSPYDFFILGEDMELCQQTNKRKYDIRKSLYFHPELDGHLTQIYMSTNDNLNRYASHMLNEVYSQKQRATEEWLKSRTDDEKMQYLSRMKKESLNTQP